MVEEQAKAHRPQHVVTAQPPQSRNPYETPEAASAFHRERMLLVSP